jgi:predicted metal-dependent peptidase
VNPLLIQDGLRPPPGTLHDESFEGMTAEEIYPLLGDLDREDIDMGKGKDDLRNDQALDPSKNHGNQKSVRNSAADPNERGSELAPRPVQLTPQEQEQLSIQWQQRLAGAAQTAMQAGKLCGSIARMVEYMRQPQLPWRAMLAKYVTAGARDDYSYSRPSSRRGVPAMFPSLRSAQISIVIGVDISGSIKKDEMNEFLSEVDAIKGNVRARVTLLPCDNVLTEGAPWIFEPWEEIRIPGHLKGGGGTSFLPVFEWVDSQDQRPDLLVYFTDAKGMFPKAMPDYPIIWLVKGGQSVPWGQRVQLN